MLNNFRKSSLAIVLGMTTILAIFASCNSQQAEKKEDVTSVKPAENAPTVDTMHMDSATTRPVKAGN